MFQKRVAPDDHSAFSGLPVRYIAVDGAGERLAVHVAGRLGVDRPALVCVAGYHRNMSDFADLIGTLHRQMREDWPVVALDLKGRGRSSDRRDKSRYVTTIDAQDLREVCSALGIGRAVFLGQGYGGQVIMALAAQQPRLIAGAILIDAGPITDPRGLVRLRNNLKVAEGLRGEAGFRTMFRRMLAPDYPGIPDGLLEVLAARTHYLDRRGRVHALFDQHLIKMLEPFEHDDVLAAQWPLFNALAHAPLMLMRTQLTEQLRREVFEEMLRRRSDAEGYIIEAQGSPALLNGTAEVEPIAGFVRQVTGQRPRLAVGSAAS